MNVIPSELKWKI